MIFQYHLDKSDYLHYLFYSTSRSAKVKKRRSINKFILMIMYLLMALFLYNRNGPVAAGIFLLLCIPLYFLYNVFEKRQYLRHFNRFIDTHFSNYIGKASSIEPEEEHFRVIDDEDNLYAYTDIEEIMETSELIIIQLKAGNAILLPKKKIVEHAMLTSTLREKTGSSGIPYTLQSDWKY